MSLDQANIIDALGLDPATSRFTLIIRHDHAWDGTPAQLYLLQEKLNAYLSFALDGEMAEAYPDISGHPLAVRIETTATPDARTLHLLAHVRKQLEFQDITLEVRIAQAGDLPSAGPAHECGGGCHCH